MSTYNGERFITQQIDSVLKQEDVEVRILIRDDGSTDRTPEILRSYKNNPAIRVFFGENIGPADSFWELLSLAGDSDYYAFCDQDDLWKPEKLKMGIQMLETIPGDCEKLYYGFHQMIDENGRILSDGTSPGKTPSSFSQALISSNAQGATMIFNQKCRDLAARFHPDFRSIQTLHDAWLLKITLGCGGKAVFDPNPYLLYRVHSANVVARAPKKNPVQRYASAFRSYFSLGNRKHAVSDTAREIVRGYKEDILPENYAILSDIRKYRSDLKTKGKLLFSDRVQHRDPRYTLQLKLRILLNDL